MKNSIFNLGKVLNKAEQENINGGYAAQQELLAGCFPEHGCFEEWYID